ncbi:ATP-binding protein [Streptomyces sp. BE303]|uniref:ATP-binding protein n=1 Tax=Streptomyces sp. BE303 TaxID=3002528 RepID=UPI002E7AABE7|nr:AAA family ATPase [Streptomyces sp. BE303]MED7950293.1 AAA family ATPase [Streptomyces sp. BE303]
MRQYSPSRPPWKLPVRWELGVHDLGGEPALPGARESSFAGRTAELRTLLGAVSDVRPAVVLVEGEAGIGKSRLVAEATSVLADRGLRVLTGGCHPLREPLAYGPVIDALRRVGPWLPPAERLGASTGALAPLLPDLAGALPPEPPRVEAGTSGAGVQRFRVVSGVRTLLEAVAPAVLVVEDVHWADEATRELLLLLAMDMPTDSALVMTYRAEELPAGRPVLGAPFRRPPGTGGAEIRLGRLGETELRTMARDLLGGEPAPQLVRTLLERSGGLPLVIEEDLLTLADSPAGTDPGALRVPRSLNEVLAERRARLGPDATALVDAAAVLAVPAGESLLALSAGLDEDRTAAALQAATAAAVLRQTGPDTYTFAHVLAQEAVYDSLPGPVRHRNHRRVLAALQTLDPPPLVQISHHARALGDRAAWLPRAQEAADQALAVGDHGTAAALLQEILDQPGLTPEQLSRAATALAFSVSAGTQYTATTAALRRIMRLPGLSVPVRATIRTSLGAIMIYRGGDFSGEEEVLTALTESGDGDPVADARRLALLAMSETGRFALAEQRAMVERGRSLLATHGDRQARAMLDLAQMSLLSTAADPAVPALLAALPRESTDLQVLQSTAMIVCGTAGRSIAVGNDARAAAAITGTRAMAPGSRLPMVELYLDCHQIMADWQAGRWDDAERGLTAFQKRYPQSQVGSGGLSATVRGLAAAARGRTAQAAAEFHEVLTRGLHLDSLGAAAGAARLHLNRDDPQAAWRTLTDPLDFLAFLDRKEIWAHAWDLVPTAVETLLALRRLAEAEALAARHATETEGRDAPGAVAEHHLCRGLLLRAADPDAAMAAFDLAAARWTAIGRPYPAALAAERAARTRTDLDDVSVRLAAPIAAFERLGATSDAARCHRVLRELGKVTSNPRGRAGYGDRLSPREEQIRDLLAAGATNKDIAAALFLSTRTVENHVARVLAKLRTTRADLAHPPA